MTVRGAKNIAASLADNMENALLYRQLATLRLDVPIAESLEDLEWRGVLRQDFEALCEELGFQRLAQLPHRWAGE